MKAKLWLPGGGVFEFCLPCFVYLAWTGSHIPAVPPAPFLGWWLGSIGEAGNCGKLRRRSVVEDGWGGGGGSSGTDMHVWKPQGKVGGQRLMPEKKTKDRGTQFLISHTKITINRHYNDFPRPFNDLQSLNLSWLKIIPITHGPGFLATLIAVILFYESIKTWFSLFYILQLLIISKLQVWYKQREFVRLRSDHEQKKTHAATQCDVTRQGTALANQICTSLPSCVW